MKGNERKLLLLAGVLFVLVLVVRILPWAYTQYRDGREQVTLLEARVARYQELIRDTEVWQARAAEQQAKADAMRGWVFAGSSASLIGSSVQRALSQIAGQAGVSIHETTVARYGNSGDWLTVDQELDFTLDQAEILPFLAALEQARPRLYITRFSVTHNRRQYLGQIQVLAFGRIVTETAR